MFMKLDLRWGHNNVRIKKGDEWKAAFITPEGLFESTVMFLSLINSLVTFQTMINELLRDLINTEKVESFIDDIMVGTESEERHNELVKETSRRIKENDLYVKLEKYKWKIKEMNFLGVVIRLEGIKMKEEKVKVVLNWPVPKLIKEVQKFLRLANYYRRFVKDFVKIARLFHKLMLRMIYTCWNYSCVVQKMNQVKRKVSKMLMQIRQPWLQ